MTAGALRSRPVLSPRAVVLLLVVAALLLSAVYPVRDYLASRRDIARLERRNELLGAEVASLRSQVRRLSTDEEVERIAREELGMVRPGERSFLIVEPPPRPAGGTATAAR